MMDNKLSELSKPVAYDYQIASACIADGHNKNGKWVDWGNRLAHECPPDWMVEDGKVTELKPLYSQEYISALLAELEAKTDFSDKAIERISGLEKACDKYLRQTKKAERELLSAKERIAELEAKLATPVRLPNKNDAEFWFGSTFQVAKFDRAVERAISAAGFKFVGNE